ncbi:hypothetical protein [Rhodococcus marinonascens]|uniref:hypothetical protein n=1 Tax=Rhodococcus marinonascens TaxID=38311 RepID=UPI000933A50D|nr:hypothetical protein [Rhodococcus marinonascens]
MFIQVMQGKVSDEEGLRRCLDQWVEELQPTAIGFLGATQGVCDDGTYIALARFESAEAARRNSERPEQGAWWAEAQKCFEGGISAMDCPEAMSWMGGGSDEAKFVQVLEGHTTDASRMRDILDEAEPHLRELRPEILGGTLCTYGEDKFVEAVYFSSESEARSHEKMENPAGLQSLFEEENRLMGDVSYYDMHAPMLVSAGR